MPDGIPTGEEAKKFYEFAKEVEQKIKAELKDGESILGGGGDLCGELETE
ncbi:hypothetical protein FACS1894109_19770 [Spirochaetia bacterium]|nr:hypothetical protein FACS1894109_19770 [Spirochaetia bacterium]